MVSVLTEKLSALLRGEWISKVSKTVWKTNNEINTVA